jgi:signal transduction histidine kinase
MIISQKFVSALLLSVLAWGPLAVQAAGDRATKAEAEAMVAKGVAAVKAKGDAAYTDITAPSKTFVDRDLYLVVYDNTGKCLAHGQNAKQVGKSLITLKDPDGKEFVKERVELASTQAKFWQDYKFTDPLTKTVQAKQAYCEKLGNLIVCGGVYKL